MLEFFEKLYQEAVVLYKTDAAFKKKADGYTLRLHQQDLDVMGLWWIVRDVSVIGMLENYERLNIKF